MNTEHLMKSHISEISFIIKLTLIIVTTSLLASAVLYFFMDAWVGSDYGAAFKIVSEVYARMNYYIATAVLLQFTISSIVIFFFALHYSHKIAGPMYRLKLTVRQYLKGEEIEKVTFRKTDFFHGIAEHFTDFFCFMMHRKKRFEEITQLLEKLDLNDEENKQRVLHKIEKKLLALKK